LALEVEKARKAIAPENILGAQRAATISPETRSKTPEPIRALNPTFAVGRGRSEVATIAAGAVKAFRAGYRAAIAQWCAGDREVAFPKGTWWMRVFHAVNIGGSV
jgi:putative transposase